MISMVDVKPAHRLVLSSAEWAVLARHSPAPLAPDVAPGPPSGLGGPDAQVLRAAARALATRGVLTPTPGDPLAFAPVDAVLANLAVLAERRAVVRVETGIGERGVRAVYAVGDPLAASLFTLAGGAVELSLFEATRLGWELVRAVPTPEQLASIATRVARALGGAPPIPLAGSLPLAALAAFEPGQARPDLSELDSDQARLARAVADQTVGVLRCLVTGRAPDGVAVGQVMWLGTDGGWVGLAPRPRVAGQAMVELVPVVREELGTWVAPYLAQILEASS